MLHKITLSLCLLTVFLVTGCQDHQVVSPATFRTAPFATGLLSPIGVDIDPSGRVWITEAGTGQNDGRVSIVTSDGVVHPVITGFDSEIFQGEPNGLNHILFADGMLYILGAHSKFYQVNVANYKVGDPTISASTLPVEDKKQWILDYVFPPGLDTEDTHLYNMVVGPGGDLYFTDAGANALIRRTKAGVWSVFAIIPGVTNPPGAPVPVSESVPTGIVYDGQRLLVSTLIGFPFIQGTSVIYQVNAAGTVSLFKSGFTSIVDINLETNLGLLLLQHGVFSPGFAHNTGKLIQVAGNGNSVLLDNLDLPTDLKQASANMYYLTVLGPNATSGSLMKITR